MENKVSKNCVHLFQFMGQAWDETLAQPVPSVWLWARDDVSGPRCPQQGIILEL